MNKAKFIQKMSSPLIGLGVLLSSYAYIPAIRAVLGIDAFITMNFSTLLIFLIGGYMAALAGFITWFRNIAIKVVNHQKNDKQHRRKPHLLGLSFLIPIPFVSCLLLGWFWQKDRHVNTQLDETYREAANFHLSLHLYLLVSFFLMPIFIGVIMFALLMITYLFATLYNIFRTPKPENISRYPINIQIAINPDQTQEIP